MFMFEISLEQNLEEWKFTQNVVFVKKSMTKQSSTPDQTT